MLGGRVIRILDSFVFRVYEIRVFTKSRESAIDKLSGTIKEPTEEPGWETRQL